MTDTVEKIFHNVVIVGAGRMGRGITMWMLIHGRKVTLIEENTQQSEDAEHVIHHFINSRGDISPDRAGEFSDNLRLQSDYENIGDAELVIECVPEDLGVKRNVFAELEGTVSAKAIIASNTSSLEISRLAELVESPGRFLGTHFFYPVMFNPIVELIRGKKTDPGLLRKLKAEFTAMGKQPISAKDSPGFVINRFFIPYINTAYWLMEELQVSAATIDEMAISIFESRQGPIQVSNWIGLHNVYSEQLNMARLGHFYQPTKGLRLHGKIGEAVRLGDVEGLSEAQKTLIRECLLGCVFFTVLQTLDEEIGSSGEIDLGAHLGLRFGRGPCRLMDELGREEVADLVRPIIELHGDGMPLALECVGGLCPGSDD